MALSQPLQVAAQRAFLVAQPTAWGLQHYSIILMALPSIHLEMCMWQTTTITRSDLSLLMALSQPLLVAAQRAFFLAQPTAWALQRSSMSHLALLWIYLAMCILQT